MCEALLSFVLQEQSDLGLYVLAVIIISVQNFRSFT